VSNSELIQRKTLLSDSLIKLLEQDLLDLAKLQKFLTLESIALRDRLSDKIQFCADTKSNLLNQIKARAQTKAKLMASAGVGIEAGKVKQGIDALGSEKLSDLWEDSLLQLKTCQEKNQVNGLVIQRSKLRNQKLMDIIRGQSQAPKLYGNQGSEKAYGGANSIAKA
jgi:flagella synthesis protein FlgN